MSLLEIIQISIASPWKLWNEVVRLLLLPLIKVQFALNGINWGKGWKIYGFPIIQKHRGSRIEIGDYLELRSTTQSNPLAPFHPVVLSTRSADAVLKIGNHFSTTGGSITAETKIIIGNNVMIGANSTVIDTDFHPVSKKNQKTAQPVVIEDNVFIGTQAIVLKGSKIVKNGVVGAGAVVTKSRKGPVLIGNPAR